ncbi:MAG TPA: hypothetical protein VHQ47_04650 [Phycisphaerae bacterium]|jgi:hypothetical protein|nr:hypothetical protein [Phycisphaerae bacterium]
MAHGRDRQRQGDHASTKNQEELDIRHNADATGRERGDMPDTPDQTGVGPDARNTSDPKPFPSVQQRSGPARHFQPDQKTDNQQ